MDPRARTAEALVVVRCQLGDRAAFSELVGLWNGPLHGFVWRMTDGDQLADDIVRTVWLRATSTRTAERETTR